MSKSTIRLAFMCLVVGLCLLLGAPRVEVSALVDPSSGISAINPNPMSPSMSLNLTFDVFYSGGLYAGEYMDRFEVTLPATWTINTVSHTNPNSGSVCTGVTSTQGHTGQLVYWQTIDGSVPDCGAWMGTGGGQHHYFTVNVTVTSCSGSPWSFPWHIDGDGFEGGFSTPPHELSGTFSSLNCVANPVFSGSPAPPGPLSMGGLIGVAQTTSFSVTNTGTLSSLLNVNQVSLTSGYTLNSGLPISGLGIAAAAQTVTIGCTPGTSPATGTLVVQTNEPGSPTYTYDLTCTQLVAVFSGSPAAPGPLTMDGPTGVAQTSSISVANVGSAGTTLDVSQVSLTSGYSISGLPINGLGTAGPAQTITLGCTPGTSPATGTLVIQTNEVGLPSHTYNLSCAALLPVFSASPAAPGPLAMASPTSTPQSASFSVSNTGMAGSLLDVSQVSLTGGYTISGLPISGQTTAAAASTITVGCTPGTSPATGTLVVQTNESGAPSYTYNLSCTLLLPVFSASPAAPGPLAMTGPGGVAQTASFDVTNIGMAGSLLDAAQVSLTGGYTISGLPISGQTTAAAAQTVTVGCTPGTSPATGALVIQTNESGAPSYTYDLTCTQLFPTLSASPAVPGPLAMTGPGGVAQTANFSVSNTGSVGSLLDVSQVSLTGGYTIGGLPISGQTTAAAASTVTVGCTPGTSPATGTLVVQSNESGAPTYTYDLTCTQLFPTFGASPAVPGPLNMMGVIGTPQTASFSVSNTGPAGSLLDVSQVSLTGGYTISGLPISGQTTTAVASTVTVGCTPGTSPTAGTLVVQTNESGTPTYTYNLTCTYPLPAFSASPAPTGPLAMSGPGGSAQTASFAVSNTGAAGSLLDVAQVSLTAGYTLSSGLPITGLGTTGPAQTVTIGCTPGTSPATGTLVVQSNESGTPSYTYDLTCTQIFPTFTGSPAAPGPLNMMGIIGTPQTASFTVSNTGPAGSLLDVAQVSLTGGYTISGLPISGQTSTAAASTVTVGCTPGTSPTAGTLVVQTNESGTPSYTYNLTCTYPLPTFSAAPTIPGPLSMMGVIGAPQTASFAVSNTGAAGSLLDVAQVSLTAGYTLTSGLPITGLGTPGPAQTVTIGCMPGTSPTAGTLVVQTNETGAPTYTYNLTCTYPLPAFSASPAVPGPLVMSGPSSVAQSTSFSVSNTGAAGSLLDVAQVSLTGGYTLTSGLPITSLGTTDPASTITLGCTPGTTPTTGTLVIQSNETGAPTYTYDLYCTLLVPGYSSSPAAPGGTIDAGNVMTGTVGDTTLSVQEVGGLDMHVSNPLFGGPDMADFSLVSPVFPFTIADGGPAQPVVIRCTPGALGLRTATLDFTTDDPANPTVSYSLTCTGVATPVISVAPADDPDRDDDGVPNAQDNCPDAYNPDQRDSDLNGLGDLCQDCPDERLVSLAYDPSALPAGGGIYCRATSEHLGYLTPLPPAGTVYACNTPFECYFEVFGIDRGGNDFNPLGPVEVCFAPPVAGSLTIARYRSLPPNWQATWEVLNTYARNGLICAQTDVLSEVALLRSDGASVPAAGAGNASAPASAACTVVTTHIVIFRSGPSADTPQVANLTHIPYQTNLTATAQSGGWYRVTYLGVAGWVSGDYVQAEADCSGLPTP